MKVSKSLFRLKWYPLPVRWKQLKSHYLVKAIQNTWKYNAVRSVIIKYLSCSITSDTSTTLTDKLDIH